MGSAGGWTCPVVDDVVAVFEVRGRTCRDIGRDERGGVVPSGFECRATRYSVDADGATKTTSITDVRPLPPAENTDP